MTVLDKALTTVVLQMQKVTKRFKRNNVCTLEPSDNMKRLWELNPDLDREATLDEQRRRQLG